MEKRDLNELFNIIDERRLIISGFGYFIGKKSGRVIVMKKGKILAQYSMSNLDEIIITSKGITLSTSLINEACKYGIKICIWSNSYPNVMLSSPQLSAFVEAKRAQFDAFDNEVGIILVKKVIASKISNQIAVIKYASKNCRKRSVHIKFIERYTMMKECINKLNSIRDTKLDNLRTEIFNIEANAARVYWGGFKELIKEEYAFRGRDPKNEDLINISLNYGYAILYSLVWMSILNSGLEPFAGFLHTDRPGKPSLVLDLSEPFKPRIVDRTILSLINKHRKFIIENGRLDDRTRNLISESILKELNKRELYYGRKLTIGSIIQSNVYSVVNLLKKKGDYGTYSMKW